jgi:Protein of unknown function (DUF3828)
MNRRLASIALAVLAVAAMFVGSAAADGEAQRFVASIYAQYGAPDTPGVVLDSREALERYFAPDLAAAIDADIAAAEQENRPPALDGDPFVDAQEWDVKNVVIAIRDDSPERAVAVVSFFNVGEPRQVELDLVKLAAGWRVDDIHWREGTLRGLYKDAERDKDAARGRREI